MVCGGSGCKDMKSTESNHDEPAFPCLMKKCIFARTVRDIEKE